MKWYWEYGAIVFWLCIVGFVLWMLSKVFKLLA